jgi:type I restriction enzyme S subunit
VSIPLPHGWIKVTLGEITEPRREIVVARSNGGRYLGLENVEARTTKVLGSGDGATIKGTVVKFQAGDTLYARLRPYLNKVCTPDFDGVASGEFIVFPAVDWLAPKFLTYFLNQPDVVAFANAHSTGTHRPRIKWDDLSTYPVLLPPLAEQHRIVATIEALFSRIDAGVEALQRARRNLQRMRAAVLQAAVTGRLVPQHVDDEPAEIVLRRAGITPLREANFPEIPESWAWVRFGDLLVLLRNGIFVSRPTDDPRGIPILRISAVRPLGLDPEDVRYLPAGDQSRDLQPFFVAHGDLLFTRYSGNPEFVGACAMVRNLPRPTLHPDKLIRAVVNEEVVKSAFVELVASTGYSRDYIRRRRRTTAGQTGVSGGDLKSMPVPLPPITEQTRIAREVERQFSIIQVLARVAEGSLERIASLRRAILSVAFHGRLVPQDFSDEPAEILLDRVKAARAVPIPVAGPGRRVRR